MKGSDLLAVKKNAFAWFRKNCILRFIAECILKTKAQVFLFFNLLFVLHIVVIIQISFKNKNQQTNKKNSKKPPNELTNKKITLDNEIHTQFSMFLQMWACLEVWLT